MVQVQKLRRYLDASGRAEPSAIRPVILPPKRSPQCWLFVAPSAPGRHRLGDGAGLARGTVGDADARRERGPDDRAAHDTRRGSRKRSDPPSCEAQGGSGVGTKRRSARVMPARVIKAAADVSPIDAFGGKATREHRIRVRSQQSERLHRVQRGARLAHEASASQSV